MVCWSAYLLALEVLRKFNCSSKVRYPFGDRLHRVQHFGTSFIHPRRHCAQICHHCPALRPNQPENYAKLIINFFSFGATAPQWAIASSFTRFLDHTQRRTPVGRTSLDEWSAGRRDIYLTTHSTQNRYPCLRWDSNPQSQLASGLWPTP